MKYENRGEREREVGIGGGKRDGGGGRDKSKTGRRVKERRIR